MGYTLTSASILHRSPPQLRESEEKQRVMSNLYFQFLGVGLGEDLRAHLNIVSAPFHVGQLVNSAPYLMVLIILTI